MALQCLIDIDGFSVTISLTALTLSALRDLYVRPLCLPGRTDASASNFFESLHMTNLDGIRLEFDVCEIQILLLKQSLFSNMFKNKFSLIR